MNTISDRIRQARKSAGLTIHKLADQLEVTPSAVAQYESGRSGLRIETAMKMADALGVSLQWLVSGEGMTPTAARDPIFYAPIVDRVQAGMWADVVSPPSLPEGVKYLELDTRPIGYAIALELEGESMLPEFKPGDIVIVDTGLEPMPGDFVVAMIDNDNQATFKKYRPRGLDDEGFPIIELAPLNTDYPTLIIDEKRPGRIIGTMIEHRRYRRKR